METKVTAVNGHGHLTIGGLDTVALASKYGTPLYVMDEDAIRANCRALKNSMDAHYHKKGLVLYASKAFCCKRMYRILNEEGLGADVVSGGELYTALQAGFPAERIYFHGNNKTADELTMALESGVGRIVVDNIAELELLGAGKAAGKATSVLFRIKPGIDAHARSSAPARSTPNSALRWRRAKRCRLWLRRSRHRASVAGIHCHIGSQIFDIDPFCHAAEVMLGFAQQVRAELGYTIEELNLGGGFGIRYVAQDDPKALESYMEAVSKVVLGFCETNSFPVPFICIEPGRSIVGDTGITLYTIGSVKTIPGYRTYVSIDGGMTDNPRYALYQSAYEAVVANKAAQQKDFTATIAGRCCESGDLIQENTQLQTPAVGDILAVLSTGAYNYSMASNYNRVPRLPVVMVRGGEDSLAVRRETYEDLVRNDVYDTKHLQGYMTRSARTRTMTPCSGTYAACSARGVEDGIWRTWGAVREN
ncbi:MAG: diaminopimelate decarboxylase [Ruthenibacterium lactatiformans]